MIIIVIVVNLHMTCHKYFVISLVLDKKINEKHELLITIHGKNPILQIQNPMLEF